MTDAELKKHLEAAEKSPEANRSGRFRSARQDAALQTRAR